VAHVTLIHTQICTASAYVILIGVDTTAQYTLDTVTQFVSDVMVHLQQNVRPASPMPMSIVQVTADARTTGEVMDVKYFQVAAMPTVTDVVDPQTTTATIVLKMLNGTSWDDVTVLTTGAVPAARHTWECVTHFAIPAMAQLPLTVHLV